MNVVLRAQSARPLEPEEKLLFNYSMYNLMMVRKHVKYPVFRAANKHWFCGAAQQAWHTFCSHLRFDIGAVMTSTRGVSGEVCFYSLRAYCTLIYNASLVIHYAACDCYSWLPSTAPALCLFFSLLPLSLPSASPTCSCISSIYTSVFSAFSLSCVEDFLLLFFFSLFPASSFHPLPLVYTPPLSLLSSLSPPFISSRLSS